MSLPHLKLYPHLVVYLDCPVSKCRKNIKEAGDVSLIKF